MTSCAPGEFCETGKYDSLIVSEYDLSVVFTCVHGDAVVEEMSRGIHGGSCIGDQEVVGNESLRVIVTLTFGVFSRG